MCSEILPARIVIQKDKTLDDLIGRGYHLTVPICQAWIERLHPRIIVCSPESVYRKVLGEQGLELMRELFEKVEEIEEMYFYSHSVYAYTDKKADWEMVERKILHVLKDQFPYRNNVQVIDPFDEELCHPKDTRNHKGLAPA